MKVNLIDVFLIVIFCAAIWTGWRKGFIVGTLSLICWIGSLVAGFYLYPSAALALNKVFPSLGVWLLPIAFIGMVFLSGILLSLLTRRILHTTAASAHAHGANKFLGIIPGAVNGMIWGTIISALLLSLPITKGISEKSRESQIAVRLATEATWLEGKIAPVFDDALNQTISKLTIRPDPDKSYALNFTVTDAKVREDLEFKMLQLVNIERGKEGLRQLEADPEMTRVARKHS